MARRVTEQQMPLGWCLDGHHEQCPISIGKLSCICTTCGDKHGINPSEITGMSPLMQSIADKYYN